jgi:hypothetical protein
MRFIILCGIGDQQMGRSKLLPHFTDRHQASMGNADSAIFRRSTALLFPVKTS